MSHEEWQDDDTQALTTTPTEKNTEEGDHLTIWGRDKAVLKITSSHPTPNPKPAKQTETPQPIPKVPRLVGTQQKWDRDERTSSEADPVVKRRRTNLNSTKQTKDEITAVDKQLIVILENSIAIKQTTPLAFERQIEQGQHLQFSKEEVLTLKGLPTEAFELAQSSCMAR